MTNVFTLLADPHAWVALVTLTSLEIVLGIDNIVFISILVSRCSVNDARHARAIGLSLALIFRILLLFALTTLIKLTYPVVTVWGNAFSWHDLILITGGLFLIAKATHEIHAEFESAGADDAENEPVAPAVFWWVILQVVVVDLVFSVDSIVTAIGLAQDIARFVAEHPTTKMLALAFLVLIGVALVADGFDFHIPRGYIYFSMGFAAAVETFNILVRRKRRA
jgi:predicted tellurium resistance membrane protein TerC